MRLVSLLPSATEILVKLGLEKNLVGVSHECDYPETVQSLPRLTSTRANPSLDSAGIHNSVLEVMKNAVSVYDLDVELLKSLKPDFIVTQDLCDVCAVSFSQVDEACRELLDCKIISLRPKKLGDVWSDVLRTAETLDVKQKGHQFQEEVDERVQAVRDRLVDWGNERPKILTIEWIDPIYVGGMWLPEMIHIAGGQVCIAESGQPAPIVSREDLAKIDPDVVVVKPCGYKLDQALKEVDLLKKQIPTWSNPPRVYLVDGNAYFNRPGPRILDSLEILAHCTHPDLFPEFGEQYAEGLIHWAWPA
ncbi:MAG: cobalamin-binding protein [Nitrospinota bacterium]|nr:cobalamin-binding protein [Nitrospinota bacterium]